MYQVFYSRSPLKTSPSASARVLPCSNVIILASSFWKRRKKPKTEQWFIQNASKGIKCWCISNWKQKKSRQDKRKWTLGIFFPPYNVVLDELLVAQEDLLAAEDGGLGPGLEGSGAGVHRCQHLLLGSFGYTSHHLISSLRSKEQPESDVMTESNVWAGRESLPHLGVININEQMIVFFSPFIFQVWYVIKRRRLGFFFSMHVINIESWPANGFDFKSFTVSQMEWKIKKKNIYRSKEWGLLSLTAKNEDMCSIGGSLWCLWQTEYMEIWKITQPYWIDYPL